MLRCRPSVPETLGSRAISVREPFRCLLWWRVVAIFASIVVVPGENILYHESADGTCVSVDVLLLDRSVLPEYPVSILLSRRELMPL